MPYTILWYETNKLQTKTNIMKKIYAVLCITKSATVNNEIVKLDEGNYIIPAFDDYEKAKVI